ncbi:MAG: hypothetical protein AAFY71_24580 [Bacteroidota bacterium]
MANIVVPIRFTLFQNGQLTYQEEAISHTNEFGVISTVVGDGTPTSSSYNFLSINWEYGPLELQVEMDYDGSGFTDFGLVEIRIPPLARRAIDADRANTIGSGVKLNHLGDVTSNFPNKEDVLRYTGSVWKSTYPAFQELNTPHYWEGSGNYKILGGLRVTDWFHVRDYNGKLGWHVWSNGGVGRMETLGSSSSNFLFSNEAGSSNWPYMRLNDELNRDQASFYILNNTGAIRLRGSNGKSNFEVLNTVNHSNHGWAGIYDANGVAQVGMYVNNSGNGVLFADSKNFVVKHPLKQDTVIVFGCLEGPELAIYERGTAKLVNGKAFVPFSEEYSLLGNHATMSVFTTPLDATSQNLAVVKKTADGFYVQELNSGTGTYEFDWQATMVRKGKENFRKLRPAREFQPAIAGEAAATNYPKEIERGGQDE